MLELPFGLRGERLVHISEVEAGLACACVCPACGHPLVARKGARRAHHFAHAGGAECAHGLQTALHLAAKQALESERRMRLPEVLLSFEYSHKPPWRLQPPALVRFDEVRLERRLSDIVPDVLIYVQGRPLLVEIAVTHAVDEAKLQKIRRLGISALEITLSDFEREPTPLNLRREVVASTRSKQWLYNARAESVRARLLALCDSKPVFTHDAQVYVADCPIGARTLDGQPVAGVVADCLACPYCVRAGHDGAVQCAGRRRLDSYARLRDLLVPQSSL